MAPNPVAEGLAIKRSSSDADLETPSSLKQLKHYRRHHSLTYRQSVDQDSADIVQNDEIVQTQLRRAISLVLNAIGFDFAEPEALESFQIEVETYLLHFLAYIRRSMLAARRVQPVPGDFLAALDAHHLTLRSLLVHLDPPVTAGQSLPRLHAESSLEPIDPHQDQLISTLLRETTLAPQSYVPSNFPSFPSRHTYKAEPVFHQRENDPQKVRERATEEGRLGEEALRRLISKSTRRDDENIGRNNSKSTLSPRQRARGLWRETMEIASKNSSTIESSQEASKTEHMEGVVSTITQMPLFGPPVNADSMYWRKPLTRKLDRKAAEL